MAEKTNAKGWTDAEKVGLLFQIIAKAGPIPWPELTLPEGRTLKACQVMIDKEKQKNKRAREEAGEVVNDSPRKRKAGKSMPDAGESEEDATPAPKKKTKGSKKKKAADEVAVEPVKAESEE